MFTRRLTGNVSIIGVIGAPRRVAVRVATFGIGFNAQRFLLKLE